MAYIVLFFRKEINKKHLIDFLKGLLTDTEIIDEEDMIVGYLKREEIDFKEISTMLINDFDADLTLLEIDTKNIEYVHTLINLYKKYNTTDFYLNEKDLLNISSKNNNELIKKEILKDYYNDNEFLNIIKVYFENDLNTSITASKLYLHRNTLINKIDKFINTTNYDIRKFKEAYIIYQLLN